MRTALIQPLICWGSGCFKGTEAFWATATAIKHCICRVLRRVAGRYHHHHQQQQRYQQPGGGGVSPVFHDSDMTVGPDMQGTSNSARNANLHCKNEEVQDTSVAADGDDGASSGSKCGVSRQVVKRVHIRALLPFLSALFIVYTSRVIVVRHFKVDGGASLCNSPAGTLHCGHHRGAGVQRLPSPQLLGPSFFNALVADAGVWRGGSVAVHMCRLAFRLLIPLLYYRFLRSLSWRTSAERRYRGVSPAKRKWQVL